MYRQRDRILYSLANELHLRQIEGQCDVVSTEELRGLCYRGTKLTEEDVNALMRIADLHRNGEGNVILSEFVREVASRLQSVPAAK